MGCICKCVTLAAEGGFVRVVSRLISYSLEPGLHFANTVLARSCGDVPVCEKLTSPSRPSFKQSRSKRSEMVIARLIAINAKIINCITFCLLKVFEEHR